VRVKQGIGAVRRQRWLRLGVIGTVVALLGLGLVMRGSLDVTGLDRTLSAMGPWAPVAFMLAYALAAVAFMPGLVFTIAGGMLFGPLLGALYSLIGATLGAVLAFLLSRHLAADWVGQRLGGTLQRIIRGVEDEGWRFVAFTRLVPLFPFNMLNYALGLTRIPLLPYTVASAVCMLPAALAYAWVGHAGAATLAGGTDAVRAMLIAIALLAAVAFLPRLMRRLRRA
jgi:uncharacterized membrane protein YdjX (TVP38/TMEM64 family)